MAKTIGSYKGIWKQSGAAAASEPLQSAPKPLQTSSEPSQVMTKSVQAAPKPLPATPQPSPTAKPSSTVEPAPTEAQAATTHFTAPPETAAQLAHRYRMLVLKEHRYKLGRDLLEAGNKRPWQLAWDMTTSLGRSYRPWAHARIFALGCYLSVDMEPEILRQLRHPLWMGRYRRSLRGLWRLLEILGQKTGQKPRSDLIFRLFQFCPPLAILIYERQLQALLENAWGSSPAVATVLAKAGQGQ